MKFVLKFEKGKIYDIKMANGEMEKHDSSSYVLQWLDNDDKKITSWCWHGNDAQDRMTRKLQQIKTSIPDMILEHETGEVK